MSPEGSTCSALSIWKPYKRSTWATASVLLCERGIKLRRPSFRSTGGSARITFTKVLNLPSAAAALSASSSKCM